ncbi:voltage-gated potassium channel [Conidiobolus coronatus NRRL 28638]|uniref:Voltage-gated potassium channel n=1 Tax=Conidiobolus coronatus (strain ATCC 28846 / CBS 209.66 / NRRL 28638) TaxID=796925 RepID=A0A137P387_CONC2|nr:voltage-gated potassium channel [Conidiobolus coronatus NRRL 28638]|eukprot:KXN69389.1 voltage-gated potassium channel [Conidiobolus coronatus NRRL 28638]
MGVSEESDYNYYSLRLLPMAAGILAPICILLSIPPLTGDWMSNSLNDQVIDLTPTQFSQDTTIPWLLRVGLICLFLAHISLLLRFLERHVVWNTWISIVGYFLNTCLTISAIVYFSTRYTIPSDEHFSGEYYSTYASSALSFIICLLLIIDYFRHNRLRGKGSGLSRNQRILVFMFILVTMWSVVGAIVMGTFEGWTFTRGIYFSLVTMTTIGFGDFAPTSAAAQGFNIFFTSIGIIMIGMLIAFIRSVILESFQAAYSARVAKIGALGLDNFYTLTVQTFSRSTKSRQPSTIVNEKVTNIPTIQDQERELKNAQVSQYIRQLNFSAFSLFLFWFLGAAIFCWLEGWDYFTAFYFCFISFTTIGYGDITVKLFASVVVFCVYSLIGLVTMAYFISVATELFSTLIERHSDRIENKHRNKSKLYSKEPSSSSGSKSTDPERDIELLKSLEINTGNEQRDLLLKLLTMTEFYHEEMTHLFKSTQADIADDDREAQLNAHHLEKMKKYENIYTQLINLCNSKLKDDSTSTISEIEEPPSIRLVKTIISESEKNLIHQNSSKIENED